MKAICPDTQNELLLMMNNFTLSIAFPKLCLDPKLECEQQKSANWQSGKLFVRSVAPLEIATNNQQWSSGWVSCVKVHGSREFWGFWSSAALFDTLGGVTPFGPSTCTSSPTLTRTHNPLHLTCDSGGPSLSLNSELHFASIQTTMNRVLSLLKINDSPNNVSALLLSLHS